VCLTSDSRTGLAVGGRHQPNRAPGGSVASRPPLSCARRQTSADRRARGHPFVRRDRRRRGWLSLVRWARIEAPRPLKIAVPGAATWAAVRVPETSLDAPPQGTRTQASRRWGWPCGGLSVHQLALHAGSAAWREWAAGLGGPMGRWAPIDRRGPSARATRRRGTDGHPG
jgi:hypothetical protein